MFWVIAQEMKIGHLIQQDIATLPYVADQILAPKLVKFITSRKFNSKWGFFNLRKQHNSISFRWNHYKGRDQGSLTEEEGSVRLTSL